MTERRGVGVSPGISIGKALILPDGTAPIPHLRIATADLAGEGARLRAAVDLARRQLGELRAHLSASLQTELTYILDAHLLMLDDDALVGATERAIETDRINAEWALANTLGHLRRQFEESDDEYFRERAGDVADVVERIQRALGGYGEDALVAPEEDCILVARDPLPSELARLDRRHFKGIALDAGGRTSHTGIIAKSLEIPAVVGLGEFSERVKNGDTLIVDGSEGVVWIQPTESQVADYRRKQATERAREQELLKNRDLRAVTADGHKIFLQANIDFPDEIDTAVRFGAEGIGLYRSEFLYLNVKSEGLPTEQYQVDVYRALAERMHPSSVIVRTIDFGGGKVRPFGEEAPERNPIMGLRAVRYCLTHREIFKTQLRALLRASVFGRLKMMFPMITSVTELRLAKGVLEEAKAELRAERIAFNEDFRLGIMIEVPAAAAIADLLAKEVDFFSIGTNDLIQFFLAIDRDNPSVSYLYEPIHPGVLRTIKFVVDAAHQSGIRVGMCGEMAAEPVYVLLLIGLGLDELSMNTISIPLVKNVIRALDRKEAARVAERALKLATAQEVGEFAKQALAARFPGGVS